MALLNLFRNISEEDSQKEIFEKTGLRVYPEADSNRYTLKIWLETTHLRGTPQIRIDNAINEINCYVRELNDRC